MDPTVIGTYTKHAQHYLARGDVAGTAFKRWLLGKQLHILPIYRLQEGAEQLHKNEETFLTCFKLLQERKSIIIFPEGICIQERRLQKLKKGIGRIAFRAEETAGFSLNLKVIPIGLNYADQRKFRSKLFINIGEPIYLSDYTERYKTDKVRTINTFTNDLEVQLRNLIVSINDISNDDFVNTIYDSYGAELIQNCDIKKGDLEKEHIINQKIAAAVNHFTKVAASEVTPLKDELSGYLKSVRSLQLRDHLLTPRALKSMSALSFLKNLFFIVVGAPLHLIGLITNYLPYWLGYTLAKKIAKNREFHASVCIVTGTFAWLFYYALQLLVIAVVFRNYALLGICALIIPVFGMFSINYYMLSLKIAGRWRLLQKLRTDKRIIEQLIAQRNSITNKLEKFKEQFIANFS